MREHEEFEVDTDDPVANYVAIDRGKTVEIPKKHGGVRSPCSAQRVRSSNGEKMSIAMHEAPSQG